MIEFQGIGDLPKDVAVADHGFLVTRNDVGWGQVIEQSLLWQGIHGLNERDPIGDAGLLYDVVDLAELSY